MRTSVMQIDADGILADVWGDYEIVNYGDKIMPVFGNEFNSIHFDKSKHSFMHQCIIEQYISDNFDHLCDLLDDYCEPDEDEY